MPEAVTLPRCVVSEFHMKSNGGKRSNRSGSTAFRARLERSRQSARECRARKKIRYQYLEELIKTREKAIYALREELNTMKHWCVMIDRGEIPAQVSTFLNEQQRRDRQLKPADVNSATDNTAAVSEYRQSFTTVGQSAESQSEQNVTSTNIQRPQFSSCLPETWTNSSAAVTPSPPDLDQCLEDLDDILQCYDFSQTDVL